MVGVLAQQQGLFAPRALPRFTATTGPSVTLSPSTDFPVLPVIRFPHPQISPRDEEGFSSCLMRPCHRAVANAPPERPAASISLRRSMLPSPPNRGFGLWIRILEVTYAFTFVTARRLAQHPMDGFVDRLHALRFLRACDPGYRALTFTLVGLPPTEHISLLLDMRMGIPLPREREFERVIMV
jgi:hypothetical protein